MEILSTDDFADWMVDKVLWPFTSWVLLPLLVVLLVVLIVGAGIAGYVSLTQGSCDPIEPMQRITSVHKDQWVQVIHSGSTTQTILHPEINQIIVKGKRSGSKKSCECAIDVTYEEYLESVSR